MLNKLATSSSKLRRNEAMCDAPYVNSKGMRDMSTRAVAASTTSTSAGGPDGEVMSLLEPVFLVGLPFLLRSSDSFFLLSSRLP
jgi:hypothetical protein